MKISTYLGNPGKKYEKTRHNAGWMLADNLSFHADLKWNTKFKGEYAKLNSPESIHLKPQTLMNLSGDSVNAALVFYKLSPDSLIVVHDELELPFGTVQLKKGGGAGGHNGLRSIIKQIGTPDFFRFRIGISRPPSGRDVSSWVLSRFSPDEEALLEDYLGAAAEIFEESLRGNFAAGEKIQLIKY